MAVLHALKYAFVWILPLISAAMWLGMLLAMFITWEVEGHPHYASMSDNQRIAYISDIGAQGLKPLFITGAVITTVFLDLSFIAERWLRHTGRLAKNLGTPEKVLSGLSIVFGIAGSAGLILLSIFDTLHHPLLHDGFLLLFIAGYIISAIFICAEYQRLGVHFRQHRILRLSFWLKLAFIIVEVILAIVFGATTFGKQQNVAAVFEWVIALIFTCYVLTFFVDLLPAARSTQEKSNQMVMRERMEMEAAGGVMENGHGNGAGAAPAEYANGEYVTANGEGAGVNGNGYAHKPAGFAGNF